MFSAAVEKKVGINIMCRCVIATGCQPEEKSPRTTIGGCDIS